MDLLDFLDFLVSLVKKDLEVQLATTVEKDQKDLWVQQDLRGNEEKQDLRDCEVVVASQDLLDHQVLKETLDFQDLRVLRGTKGNKVH